MKDLEVGELFDYRMMSDEQVLREMSIRDMAHDLAMEIQKNCPESREKAQAITAVQQAFLWAYQSIRNHGSSDHGLRNVEGYREAIRARVSATAASRSAAGSGDGR